MLKIDMNTMVNLIFMREDNRTEANVAQIKEVIRIFLEELSEYSDDKILEVVKQYKKNS
jgi:hypothetical protein